LQRRVDDGAVLHLRASEGTRCKQQRSCWHVSVLSPFQPRRASPHVHKRQASEQASSAITLTLSRQAGQQLVKHGCRPRVKQPWGPATDTPRPAGRCPPSSSRRAGGTQTHRPPIPAPRPRAPAAPAARPGALVGGQDPGIEIEGWSVSSTIIFHRMNKKWERGLTAETKGGGCSKQAKLGPTPAAMHDSPVSLLCLAKRANRIRILRRSSAPRLSCAPHQGSGGRCSSGWRWSGETARRGGSSRPRRGRRAAAAGAGGAARARRCMRVARQYGVLGSAQADAWSTAVKAHMHPHDQESQRSGSVVPKPRFFKPPSCTRLGWQ
jgi:hypothetical protein